MGLCSETERTDVCVFEQKCIFFSLHCRSISYIKLWGTGRARQGVTQPDVQIDVLNVHVVGSSQHQRHKVSPVTVSQPPQGC